MNVALASLASRFGLSLLTAAVLAGCAGLPQQATKAPDATGAASTASASPPAVAGSAPRPPGATTPALPSALKPFDEVVKGATKIDGMLTLYRKDDKVWIELKPADLNTLLFLSPKYKTGIGEKGLYGGTMIPPWLVQFRRINNLVQLIAVNTDYVARAGTPAARAVEAAFSPSLLGSSPVLSQPSADGGGVLIEANPIFVSDLLGTGMRLQRAYRQGYVLDGRNSAITEVRGTPDAVVFEVLNHFATGTIAVGTGMGPSPSTPDTLPDPRSLFMTMNFSLARLPATQMAPRRADARIGHFTSTVDDFSDDVARTPHQRIVNRWRLEKKDPSAPLSEPVKPIVFWVDRTVPEKYRPAVMAGILEWNKAFERIGFKNAIQAKIQPDDADFDTLDFGHASVRWMTNASPSYGAIGPRHVDPRTGEILDADIAIESLSSRAIRSIRSQVLTPVASERLNGLADGQVLAPDGVTRLNATPGDHFQASLDAECDYADMAAEQTSYALDVLEARGEIDPGSDAAQKFVLAYLRDTTMHEVGHTLGLRHNFRASRAYTEEQLADPAFTAANGISGSVMEYSAINLAAPGTLPSRQGSPFQSTLGPYDYWAIEYAYKPIEPSKEKAELAKIAARSNEPLLAYGTDEDNFLGIDPESLQFDLGSDVLAFARKRIAIAQDLLARQEKRELRSDEDYSVLRRSVNYALRDVARAGTALSRQIGGVRTLRDFPGSGRDPLVPVPAAQQRQALDLMTTGILSADSFRLSPGIQRKLAIDFQERWDAVMSDGAAAVNTDYSLAAQTVGVQRGLLGQLMSDAVATRLLDSEGKGSRPTGRTPGGAGSSLAAASPSGAMGAPQRGLTLVASSSVDAVPGGADGSASAAKPAVQATAAVVEVPATTNNDVTTPALRLSELYARVTKAVWSELQGGDIPPLRRELQRDYLNRMTTSLLKPTGASRADARSLLRAQARTLQKQIDEAEKRPASGLSLEARAHLRDCADTLEQTLAAPLQRTGA